MSECCQIQIRKIRVVGTVQGAGDGVEAAALEPIQVTPQEAELHDVGYGDTCDERQSSIVVGMEVNRRVKGRQLFDAAACRFMKLGVAQSAEIVELTDDDVEWKQCARLDRVEHVVFRPFDVELQQGSLGISGLRRSA